MTRLGFREFLRIIFLGALSISFVHSLWTTVRLNFRDHSSVSEPYVYVQSTLEFKKVIDVIAARIRAFPEDFNMGLAILNRDPWPLPWLYGHYPNVQWGGVDGARMDGVALFLIDHEDKDVLEARLSGTWLVMPFQIRGSYQKGYAYLEFERFKGFVPAETPIFRASAQSNNRPSDQPSDQSNMRDE